MTDREKLDTICKEAFARLDAIDLALYHRGFVTCKGSWHKPSIPQSFGGDTAKKPKGPSPLNIDKPTGPNILGPNNGAKVLAR